jgi:protein-S-isoprenylcysteine O-methyltransferase Ste14
MNTKNKMTRWGIGPLFALLSISYGLFAFVLAKSKPTLRIDFIPYPILSTIGVIFILVGIPFFIISVKSLHHAYNSNSLITTGIYGICRHPMYGVWIIFIVPGIALVARSFLGLTTPVVMYILLRMLAKKRRNIFGRKIRSSISAIQKKNSICIANWLDNNKIITTQSR